MTSDKMAWAGRSVLVTGGNGFLGSCLTRRLVDAGARVVCLLKEEIPLSRFVLDGTERRVVRVPGLVEDFAKLSDIFREYRVDACFHLAAQPIVGEAQRDPLATMEPNVRGTYNLLEAARQWGGLRALVVASSDKVYGDAERLPYVETDRLAGLDPYDASKVATDVLAQSFARSFGLPVGIARSGNFYGPGDLQWSRIVPGTIRALVRGEAPVIRSDGTPVRDYFFVEDAADAFLTLGLALDRAEVRGEAFNFGTGRPTTVRDLVGQLIARSGRAVEPRVLGEAKGEIQAQYLDTSKAARLLGWEHETALGEGLAAAWDWYLRLLDEHRGALG